MALLCEAFAYSQWRGELASVCASCTVFQCDLSDFQIPGVIMICLCTYSILSSMVCTLGCPNTLWSFFIRWFWMWSCVVWSVLRYHVGLAHRWWMLFIHCACGYMVLSTTGKIMDYLSRVEVIEWNVIIMKCDYGHREYMWCDLAMWACCGLCFLCATTEWLSTAVIIFCVHIFA